MKVRVIVNVDKEYYFDNENNKTVYPNKEDLKKQGQNFTFEFTGYNSVKSLQPLMEMIVDWFKVNHIEFESESFDIKGKGTKQ